MTIRTSSTHPIRVDWLTMTTPGKVGLTFAPGKHAGSKGPGGRWERNLELDLDRLVAVFHAKALVCLLEDEELARARIPQLLEAARRRGIIVHRLPIPDGGVLPDPGSVRDLVELVHATAAGGSNVVVHCMGGLGRAGTIGACVLVGEGMSAAAALEDVQRARGPRSPETAAQKAFVRRYAEQVASPTPAPPGPTVLSDDATSGPSERGAARRPSRR
jgi:ADP-ribosyl-[dinitrogen reductase] hydrolase